MTIKKQEILNLYKAFLETYDPESHDELWAQKSLEFRQFWKNRILNHEVSEIADDEIDQIVRIMDRNAKGNTVKDEAVAKVMITNGVWRRAFKEIKQQKSLHELLSKLFEAHDPQQQIKFINELYQKNEKNRNGLSGNNGNMLSAMMFTYNPSENISVVSLNHRKKIIDFFAFLDGPDFKNGTPGEKIVQSNLSIIKGFRELGITDSPRTFSYFLYKSSIEEGWNDQTNEAPWSGSRPASEDVVVENETSHDSEVSGDPSLFYMESQLEDFLIQNWENTELGKKYDLIEEDGNLVSQQYRIGIGRIDILVKEKNSNRLVVIELKKDQTSDDTVGQLARYMGWLEENKTGGEPTKGIIIAARYDERLYYALKKIKDAEVYLYKVDFSLREFKK